MKKLAYAVRSFVFILTLFIFTGTTYATNGYYDSFNSLSAGQMPSGWVSSGNWAIVNDNIFSHATEWGVPSHNVNFTKYLKNNSGSNIAYYNTSYSDFDYLATIKVAANSTGAVIFRRTDDRNYYYFSLDAAKNTVTIGKCVDGTSTDIKSINFNIDPSVLYHLRITAVGNKLTCRILSDNEACFFRNQNPGTPVEAEDTTFTSGNCGFLATGGVTDEYNDVSIIDLSKDESISNSTFSLQTGAYGEIKSLKLLNEPYDTNFVCNEMEHRYEIGKNQFLGELKFKYQIGSGAEKTVTTGDSEDVRSITRVSDNKITVSYLTDSAKANGIQGATDFQVVETYSLTDDNVKMDIEIKNMTNQNIRFNDIGLPVSWNNHWQNEEPYERYVAAADNYISYNNSYVLLERAKGGGNKLVFTPDSTTDTSLEYRKFTSTQQVWGNPPEEYYIKSNSIKSEGQSYLPNTYLDLPSGATHKYSFKFSKATDYLKVGDILYNEGLIDTKVNPGMILPNNITAKVDLHTSKTINSVEPSSPANATIKYVETKPGDHKIYNITFSKLGRNDITITYDGDKKSVLQFWIEEPIDAAIQRHVDFLIKNCRITDPKDPHYEGFLEWDNVTNKAILSGNKCNNNDYEQMYDGPAFIAEKNVYYPKQSEITIIDDYLQDLVWTKEVINDPNSADYGYLCHKCCGTLCWNDDKNPTTNPDMKCTRIYNYPRMYNSFFSMYNVEKNYPNLTFKFDRNVYLQRAAAIAKRGIELSLNTGTMGEQTIPEIIQALKDEGFTKTANELTVLAQQKCSTMNQQKYPFGSEFGTDSTGEEGAYIYSQMGNSLAGMKSTIDKSMAWTGKVPVWYWQSTSNRQDIDWWAFQYTVGLHGKILNDYYMNYVDNGKDYWSMIYPFNFAPFVHINSGQPELIGEIGTNWGNYMSSKPYNWNIGFPYSQSSESDVALWAGLRLLSADVVVNDNSFGLSGYGCDVVDGGSTYDITPKDGLYRRLNIVDNKLAIQLNTDSYSFAKVGKDNKSVEFTLNNVAGVNHTGTISVTGLAIGNYDVIVNGVTQATIPVGTSGVLTNFNYDLGNAATYDVVIKNNNNPLLIAEAGNEAIGILSEGTALTGSATQGTATSATWSKLSGPGTVSFANANSLNTTVNFSEVGVYVLKLTISDGLTTTSDTVRITVKLSDKDAILADIKLADTKVQDDYTVESWNAFSKALEAAKAAAADDNAVQSVIDADKNALEATMSKLTLAPANLVLQYKFDEGTGTDIADASGHNNNGALNGTPNWVDGQIGKALQFDGKTNIVNAGNSTDLQPRNLSVSFWLKRTGDMNNKENIVFWAKPTANYASNGWFITLNGGLILMTDGGNDFSYGQTPNDILPLNQWTHLALTFDSTKGEATLYVNGVPHQMTKEGASFSISSTADNKYIGYSTYSHDSDLNAVMDDFRIYKGVLTSSEITAIMNGSTWAVKPQATPSAGAYATAQTVILTTATPGADIYYTLNGNDPTTDSTKYTTPIDVTSTETIKAIAVKAGMTNSEAVSFDYIIKPAPIAPLGVTAVAGDRSAVISWNGVDGATGYSVYKDGNRLDGTTYTVSGSVYSSAIAGLTNGTNYSFTVKAINEVGESAASNPVNVTPRTVPGAPTGVTGTIGDGQVTVSFTAPQDNGGSQITSYIVTSNPGNKTATGTSSPITVTGLTNNVPYTFTVVAVNAAGNGAVSAQSKEITPKTISGAPTGIIGVAGDRSATISWNGVLGATGYKIYKDGVTVTDAVYTVANDVYNTVSSLVYSSNITGLINGTNYSFTVSAINEIGEGPNSNSVNVTPKIVPQMPTDVKGIPADGQATVSFIEPQDNGGSPIVSYTVISSPGNKTATGTSSPITVTGLTNGIPYTFTVTATNAAGTGAASLPSAAVTPKSVPAAPSGVIAKAGDKSATINWNGVTGAVGYKIYNNGATVTDAVYTVSGSVYSSLITGLTNGTNYVFTVKAFNEIGESASSNPANVIPATVPGTPSGVVATAGNGVATVSFSAPIDNGGIPITGYTVISNPGKLTATGTGTAITITGLTNGTSYTFTVKATNAMGIGAESAASNAVTPYAPSNNNNNNNNNNQQATANNNSGAQVLVNGNPQNAGSVTETKAGDQTETILTVDAQLLAQQIAKEGKNAVVAIPFSSKSDIVAGQLTGDMVKGLENAQAVIQIKTDSASYSLPAQQINIDDIAAKLGSNIQLKDIKVQVEIAKPTADTVKVVEDSAKKGSYTIVAAPVDFTVTCTFNNKTVTVKDFNSFVERTIALPDGVDLAKVTTGVVTEPDGTVRHVPTRIASINGKYFAIINSPTNSTYSVIWNPVEFKDVANHWSKADVDDMGSRMIVSGVGNNMFEPDKDITRAEFAAIIVRALGLKASTGASSFSDVSSSDWYSGYIKAACDYKLITGYSTDKFAPNNKITREEAMTIIARAMSMPQIYPEESTARVKYLLKKFNDGTSVSSWAQTNVAACIDKGITQGSNKNIAPKSNITRAEVAAMIRRFLQKAKLIN